MCAVSPTFSPASPRKSAPGGRRRTEACGSMPAYVRAIIRARRRRDEIFGKKKDLFSDPAWDMLLDLYLSRLEGRRVAVSSLCIAASVPSTTALRWIKTMCDHGLFVRSADPEDGRRFFIHLSDDAVAHMDEFFRCAQRAGPPVA